MKKLKLSGFDLGFIIAFVVLTVMGIGAWWYFSGLLTAAQQSVTSAKSDFDKVSSNTKYKVVVSAANAKNLQGNIDLLKEQIDPVIMAKFLSKDNKLGSINNEDPVAWKHDLDDEVHRLNTEAKNHLVSVPANFYFGFSQYRSQNPQDDQTGVLSKQLVAIDQITTALINAPIHGIMAIRRTYEEDSNSSSAPGQGDQDRLAGHSLTEIGNIYTAYPFEADFETTSEDLRTVMAALMNSPYVFVVRTVSIQNTVLNSPQVGDLEKMGGSSSTTPSMNDTSPGEVAASAPTKGPQFLFGNSFLKVKMRIDMIEWNAGLVGSSTASGTYGNGNGNGPSGRSPRNPSTPGVK